jgi:mRNA-degrading endonuclease toxin of MazEF toxin-antitoxin module
MAYIPEQGDIVWLDFDPSNGKEIIKRRPAFVISKKAFNVHVKMAIVAPITSTIRGIKLEVELPENTETQGAIMVYQLKSIDFTQRKIKFIEKSPANIIQQVYAIAHALIQ